jgi:hypothetical protein
MVFLRFRIFARFLCRSSAFHAAEYFGQRVAQSVPACFEAGKVELLAVCATRFSSHRGASSAFPFLYLKLPVFTVCVLIKWHQPCVMRLFNALLRGRGYMRDKKVIINYP